MESNKIVKRQSNKKIFKSLKSIKANFCNFITKDANYEYVAYDQSSSKEDKRNGSNMIIHQILHGVNDFAESKNKVMDDLASFLSPRRTTESRSRLPMYYKTASVANAVSQCDNYEMPWHSTKIDFDPANITEYQLSQLHTHQQQQSNGSSNLESPQRYNTVCDDTQKILANSYDSSMESSPSSEASSNANDTPMEDLYACCVAYKAIHDGDLTIDIADRVHILYETPDSEYILVKHIRTAKCGYVPRICVLNVNKFLNDLN